MNEYIRLQRFYGSTGWIQIDSESNARVDFKYSIGYLDINKTEARF